MTPLALSTIAMLALTQVPAGSVAGFVLDVAGQPIAGALVSLDDVGRATLSDVDGSYRLASVPAGPRHLTVSRIGFETRTVHVLVPGDGSVRIDVSLDVRPIPLPGLAVDPRRVPPRPAPPPGLPERARVLTMAEVEADPRLAEPDVLAALVGAEISAHPEAPDGLSVRGGAPDQTAYLLDGIPVFDPVHAAGTFGALNPSALSDVGLLAPATAAHASSALGGVVTASTLPVPDRRVAEAALSTSHAALMVTGPIGSPAIGYLASMRSGFPGALASDDERSLVGGRTDDLLATAQAAAFGGTLRLLFFDAENELDAAAALDPTAPDPQRHAFEWHSRSVGAAWKGGDPLAGELSLAVWSARVSAAGRWAGTEGPEELASRRSEAGVQAVGRFGSDARSAGLGARLTSGDTRYATTRGTSQAERPVTTVFGDAGLRPADGLWLGASTAVTLLEGRTYVAPGARLTWRPSAAWGSSAWVARSHQPTQSLRNPESVVGRIFPANPSVAAGTGGVPVPASDQVGMLVEWSPVAATLLELQTWLRRSRGVLLVAPLETGPFASAPLDPAVAAGRTSGQGFSVSASGASSRLAWNGRWVWERSRSEVGDLSWTPSRTPDHRFDGGVVAYPSPTTSISFAVFAALGRRATDVGQPFEWETCNLLDGGCEFAGAPHTTGPPGARRLGAYFRADIGARKHWHVPLGGRSSTLALHVTISNVFASDNTLVWVTGEGSAERVQMRPLSPLVVGVDWRF